MVVLKLHLKLRVAVKTHVELTLRLVKALFDEPVASNHPPVFRDLTNKHCGHDLAFFRTSHELDFAVDDLASQVLNLRV